MQTWIEYAGVKRPEPSSKWGTGTKEYTPSNKTNLHYVTRGAKGKKATTKQVHKYCPKDQDGNHVCGTNNRNACGGRREANRYSMSMVSKNDITEYISIKRQQLAVTNRRMICPTK